MLFIHLKILREKYDIHSNFSKRKYCPEGSVVKSTAIDKTVIDDDGVYRKIGPARIFISEADAIKAVKDKGANGVKAGDIMVVVCGGPKGTGIPGGCPNNHSIKIFETRKRGRFNY